MEQPDPQKALRDVRDNARQAAEWANAARRRIQEGDLSAAAAAAERMCAVLREAIRCAQTASVVLTHASGPIIEGGNHERNRDE